VPLTAPSRTAKYWRSLFGGHLDSPREYVRQFLLTTLAFLKGDPRLLIRNPRFLSPSIYFGACLALAVAFIKSAWPDDPIKTFDTPSIFRSVQPFLDLIPLPLFASVIAYLTLINVPMFILSKAFGYNINILRLVADNSYT
jgi:hypothetical protein